MKNIPVALFALLLTTAAAFADAPFLDMKFDDALKKAAAEKKIVLVDFYTTWCGPCKRNDKNLWPDPTVQQLLNTQTVPLRVDAEADDKLAARYHAGTYPSMILIKPDGTEIDRIVGEYTPKDFIASYQLSMSGETSEKRARAAVAKSPQDLDAHYNLAELLRQKGGDPEALQEFIWCFNHLADDTAAAARLQFPVMNSYEIQGETYPPAQQSWATLQANLEKKALAGPLDSKTAVLLGIINDNMGHPEKTLATFDQLPAESRALMIGPVLGELVKTKRYADIIAVTSHPAVFFEQQEETYKAQLASIADSDDKKAFEKDAAGAVVSAGAGYFEALAGSSKDVEALGLAREILQFSNTDGTRSILVKAAHRAGNDDLTDAMKELK